MRKQVSEQGTKSKTEAKTAKVEESTAKKNETATGVTEQPKVSKKIEMTKVSQSFGKVTSHKDLICCFCIPKF